MNHWQHYHTPTTINDALDLMRQYGDQAQLIAGGTDLILDMQSGNHAPVTALIDVTTIEGLSTITNESDAEGQWVVLGAAVTHTQIERSPLIQEHGMALVESCSVVGGPQVRNVATIGGNVAHALPAADGTIGLLALNAQVQVCTLMGEGEAAGSLTCEWQPLLSIFVGPGRNNLKSNQLLGAFRFLQRRARQASAFDRIMRPQGVALPILGLAANVTLDESLAHVTDATIAIGPAGPIPFHAASAEAILTSAPYDDELLDAAIDAAQSQAQLRTSRHRASQEYRHEMIAVLLRRVLPSARLLVHAKQRSEQQSLSDEGISPMPKLTLTVNGTHHDLELPHTRTLAQVLRYDLGLTGTKIGCNEAECGACTVIVNGQSVDSCIYPAFKAQGASVLTIEGVAGEWQQCNHEAANTVDPLEQLHPLQQAFVTHGATQCGFCTPGLILQAKTMLDENPAPDDDAIKHCLKDTYCRCTGYVAILSAVRAAANKMQGGELTPPTLPAVMEPLENIGQPLARPDAIEKVTGVAKYTDDYTFPGMLHGATLRSAHPHARIVAIDSSAALTQAGVAAVLTYKDVPGDPRHGLVENDWPVFAGSDFPARYVGDPIALVVAESEAEARAALAHVHVTYEVLPAVVDPVSARKADAPVLHPDRPNGNLLKHIKVRQGDIEAGFAQADVIIERTYRTPMTEHAFLEPECSVALPAGYDADHPKLTIYVGSQIPYSDRRQTAKSLGLEDKEIRIRGTVMGGGFGGKEDIAAQIHAALAAKITGRPVKILYTREESLRFHPKRHATIIRVKTGATRDGKVVAVEAELYGDSGAYASLGEKVMTRATTHATGPYVVANTKIDCYAMYTNNAPCGAFRGFGVTQSAFAVESNMDLVAQALGMDPIEFRRINAMRVGTTTATGQHLRESVGLLDCLDQVEDSIRRWWREELPKLPNAPSFPAAHSDLFAPVQIGRKRYAWGLAAGYKNTGLGGGAPDKAEAEVEVYPDGRAEIRTSSAEIGQNLIGVLVACTAEELGLPARSVNTLVMDTDLTPDGGPTTASRQTYVSGNAARLAARAMRERMQTVLAEKFDVPPDVIAFHEGLAYVDEDRLARVKTANGSNGHNGHNGKNGHNGQNGTNGSNKHPLSRTISFAEAVQAMLAEGREAKLRYEYWAPKTQPLGTGGDMHFAFSYAIHAALVSVDLDTGEVAVERVAAAHDVGRAINPLSLTGQIEGGIVMGIGNALTEHYIEENGVPWTQHLGQYKMPGIKHTPIMENFIVEAQTADGPFGAKGVGEISSIPISPAITNAIATAVGVRCRALPVDQDALLLAMQRGESEIDRRWGDPPA